MELGTGEQFQVQQHLVVTGTPAVDFLSHIAQPAGEHEFHLGMYILYPIFYDKLTTLGSSINVLQLCQNLLQLLGCEQSDGLKHGGMSHGAQHIVLGQIEVHLTVTAHGKPLYLCSHLHILFPKFSRHIYAFRLLP